MYVLKHDTWEPTYALFDVRSIRLNKTLEIFT